MGRSPCCSKDGLNRGAWTASEDKILTAYINSHGEGKWRSLPKRAGLKRCGKSCRLRWLNYLRPGIKRGNITQDEEELIIRLHRLLGNRWSLIAGRLPGRTDNEIKNYWNTTLAKKAKAQSSATPSSKGQPSSKSTRASAHEPALKLPASSKPAASATKPQPQVIQTKATRCTKVVISTPLPSPKQKSVSSSTANSYSVSNLSENQAPLANDLEDYLQPQTPKTQFVDENHHLHEDYSPEVNCLGYGSDEFQVNIGADISRDFHLESGNMCMESLPIEELMVEKWSATQADALENNGAMDLDSLASLLDSEGWPQL